MLPYSLSAIAIFLKQKSGSYFMTPCPFPVAYR
nr:MAG TPA: hypothetical protein [Caudoviricetes sp.]